MGSGAAAPAGGRRIGTAGLFASFWSQKEGPNSSLPSAKKQARKNQTKKHPRVGRNQLPRVFSVYYLLLASAGRNRRVRVYTISWMAQSLSARQTSQPSVQAGGTGVRGNM